MKILPVRIPFGSAFYRVFLLAAVISEYQLWNRLRPWFFNRGTGFRVAAMILKSPKALFTSFFIAAVATVVLDAFVRVVMGPILARWYSPQRRDEGFGSPLAFHLGSNESVLSEMPARRANGRQCPAGTLVRTNARLWFSPHAWDSEPWSIANADMAGLLTRAHETRLARFLEGLPDRVVICDSLGRETSFLVQEPAQLLAWYPEKSLQPLPDYEPSPLELL